MPTYEYLCKSCGHKFEKFQKMSDKPLKKCPKCGKKAQRLISGGAGIIFKGTGFYATDYKKSAPKDKSAPETPDKDKPCCGRSEPCPKPPCADGGSCDKK